jgi:hypothetical protein
MLEKPITWHGVNFNMQDANGARDPWNVTEGYIIWCRTVDGIGVNDWVTDAHKRPRKIGDASFDPASPSGSSLTFSGIVVGRDMAYLRAGQAAMWSAWWAAAVTDKLYFQFAGMVPAYVNARLDQKPDMPEEVTRQDRVERTWTFVARCDDPRYYKVSDDSLLFAWQV